MGRLREIAEVAAVCLLLAAGFATVVILWAFALGLLRCA